MAKYSSKVIKGSAIKNILHMQLTDFIEKNKEECLNYEKVLTQAATIIFRHPEMLPNYLNYRVRRIQSQFDHDEEQLTNYLTEKKGVILLQTIKR